jgi:hypothetical protein
LEGRSWTVIVIILGCTAWRQLSVILYFKEVQQSVTLNNHHEYLGVFSHALEEMICLDKWFSLDADITTCKYTQRFCCCFWVLGLVFVVVFFLEFGFLFFGFFFVVLGLELRDYTFSHSASLF